MPTSLIKDFNSAFSRTPIHLNLTLRRRKGSDVRRDEEDPAESIVIRLRKGNDPDNLRRRIGIRRHDILKMDQLETELFSKIQALI